MKILFTGLGSIGQRHARNLRVLQGEKVDLIAFRRRGLPCVVNEDLTAVPNRPPEKEYGIRLCESLEEALDEKPDAVFVTNPSGLHVETAMQAARRGCALFIEKPLSDRWEGVEDLIEVCERNRVPALVGYQMRFHPALRRIRDLLRKNGIGRVVQASLQFGDWLPGAHPYEDYRQGYAARRDLGGGAVLSLIHEIDMAFWLFGMPERVFAVGGHLSSLEMDVEDCASLLLDVRSSGRPLPVQIALDFLQRPPSRSLRILGEEGKVEWDFFRPELAVYRAGPGTWERESFSGIQRNDLFLEEVRHFLRCVREGEAPEVSLRDAAASLRIALAAKESMVSGKSVEVTP